LGCLSNNKPLIGCVVIRVNVGYRTGNYKKGRFIPKIVTYSGINPKPSQFYYSAMSVVRTSILFPTNLSTRQGDSNEQECKKVPEAPG
jgi:hypothetical protein